MSKVVPLRPGTLEPRWKAECTYRCLGGTVVHEHVFEEIAELDDLIERGPDWRALVSCVVTLNRRDADAEGLTIEEAARL